MKPLEVFFNAITWLVPFIFSTFISAGFMEKRESSIIESEAIFFTKPHYVYLYMSSLSYYFISLPLIISPLFKIYSVDTEQEPNILLWIITIISVIPFICVSKRIFNIIWQYLFELFLLIISIIILNVNWYIYFYESFIVMYIAVAYWIIFRGVPLLISSIRIKQKNPDITLSEFLYLIDSTIISYTPIYTATLFNSKQKSFFKTIKEILPNTSQFSTSPSKKYIKKCIEEEIQKNYSDTEYLEGLFSKDSPEISAYKIIAEICYNFCTSGKYHFKYGKLDSEGRTYFSLYVKVLEKLVSKYQMLEETKNDQILEITERISKTSVTCESTK